MKNPLKKKNGHRRRELGREGGGGESLLLPVHLPILGKAKCRQHHPPPRPPPPGPLALKRPTSPRLLAAGQRQLQMSPSIAPPRGSTITAGASFQ